MSDHSEDQRQCGAVAEELSELALGILSGRRRSEVLSHVESCARCRVELEQLALVADTILQLAPESEPPLGFEQRLAERMQATGTVRWPGRLRRISALAAAVFLVVLGFGLGVVARGGNGTSQGGHATVELTSAALTSRGEVLGQVFVSQSKPEWILVSIDNGVGLGAVICEVTLSDGRVETAGRFDLSAGYGAWSAPLKSSVAQVRATELLASDGAVLASARFPA